jgi:D-beta-D-heptose 7-phosphate kinase / D-beta-D-heptose 1-phosphate adenosyltransferase
MPLPDFSKVRALVIGDAIIDQYHFGRVDRMCPEAPVPIFVEDYSKTETRRGGADNVAHQLEVLGCQVYTVFPKRRSVKHRYFAGHHLVFRRDSDSQEIANEDDLAHVYAELPGVNVVVLSDYNKGFLTRELCQAVMGKGVPVVVDPKCTDWSKYQGADILCPNQHEYDSADKGTWEPDNMVIKRGALGLCVTMAPKLTFENIPARARQVFDVTGAGDTVTAVVAACMGTGTTHKYAAECANYAAGVVVGKLGTAVCTLDELREAMPDMVISRDGSKRKFRVVEDNRCA